MKYQVEIEFRAENRVPASMPVGRDWQQFDVDFESHFPSWDMGHEFSIYQSDGGLITLVVEKDIKTGFLTEAMLMRYISTLEKELNEKLMKNLDDAFGIVDNPKLTHHSHKALTPLATEETAKAAIEKHIPTIRDKWNRPGGPAERLAAERFGKRGGTRRFKKKRLMSRKYCKKTPCRRMGFTQRASCRPYKNCFNK
jgi:hypothetical protein